MSLKDSLATESNGKYKNKQIEKKEEKKDVQ